MVLYQTEFRKPTHTVFCLDYSGSMDGDGNTQLVNAMDYILTIEKASKNMVQFSKKDKITVIAFDNEILSKFDTSDGSDTVSMIDKIKNLDVRGSTNLYKPLANALNILNKEDINKYNLFKW